MPPFASLFRRFCWSGLIFGASLTCSAYDALILGSEAVGFWAPDDLKAPYYRDLVRTFGTGVGLRENRELVFWAGRNYGFQYHSTVQNVRDFRYPFVLKEDGRVFRLVRRSGALLMEAEAVDVGGQALQILTIGGEGLLVLRVDGTVAAYDKTGAVIPQKLRPGKAIACTEGEVAAVLHLDGTVTAFNLNNGNRLAWADELRNISQISAADDLVALDAEGKIARWGDNIGAPTEVEDFVQIGSFSGLNVAEKEIRCHYGLRSDGQLEVWGAGADDSALKGLTNVVHVWDGGARLANGDIIAEWPSTYWRGTQAVLPAYLRGVQDVQISNGHGIALLENGTVRTWRSGGAIEVDVPADLNNVLQVAVGRSFWLALDDSGTVHGWGSNEFGQLDLPVDRGPASFISAGRDSSLITYEDGTVAHLGAGASALPQGLALVKEAVTNGDYSFARHGDGTLTGWAVHPRALPPGLGKVTKIGISDYMATAIDTAGAVHYWWAAYDEAYGNDGYDDGKGDISFAPEGEAYVDAAYAGFVGDATIMVRADGTVAGFPDEPVLGMERPTDLPPVSRVEAQFGVAIFLYEPDADNDGLPDAWELNHFGDLSATPDADDDHDGHSNDFEYLLGLDPRDPTSRIRTIVQNGTVYFGPLSGQEGLTYRLWWSNDWGQTGWSEFSDADLAVDTVEGHTALYGKIPLDSLLSDDQPTASQLWLTVTPAEE
ncbi:MAG: hypothetical protein Q7P63_11325 [Verrucomicrobiota bacterium JB022]|nr:hypothetical protein [Verrucomicrobiota bacterium JB022]